MNKIQMNEGVRQTKGLHKQDNDKGIKVPRSLKPILTGKFDSKEHIKYVVKKGNLTYSKEEIRYLLGLCAISRNGDVSNPEMPYIIRMLENLLDDNTFDESTYYGVHRKLVAKGVLKEFSDNDKKLLRIVGFERGKDFVEIPYDVFTHILKINEKTSIKIIFDIYFLS